MTIRARKLIGSLALVAFVTIYALFAMELGARFFVEAAPVMQAIYYLVAGLIWVPVAALLISWMQRPDP